MSQQPVFNFGSNCTRNQTSPKVNIGNPFSSRTGIYGPSSSKARQTPFGLASSATASTLGSQTVTISRTTGGIFGQKTTNLSTTTPTGGSPTQLSLDGIWSSKFPTQATGTCPLCESTQLLLEPRNWVVKHLIPVNDGGPDIFPNTWPICGSCVQSLGGDVNIPVFLCQQGKFGTTEQDEMLATLWQEFEQFNPQCSECKSSRTSRSYTSHTRQASLRISKHSKLCWDCLDQKRSRMDCSADY